MDITAVNHHLAEVVEAATLKERDMWKGQIGFALDLAQRYGAIDGDHHKMWVIDQMVRSLINEEGYKAWLIRNPEWDEGIAP